jgi:hypothetical protein
VKIESENRSVGVSAKGSPLAVSPFPRLTVSALCLLLTASLGTAQVTLLNEFITGEPGGLSLQSGNTAIINGNPTITPASFAGLVGWWDANALSYTNATPIDNASAKWTDLSGQTNNLIQATAANRPQVLTNIINGKRAVRFDGLASPNNDKLAMTSTIAFAAHSNFTAIVVGLVTADSVLIGCVAASGVQIRRTVSVEKMIVADQSNSHFSDLFATAHGTAQMMTVRRTGDNITIRENKTDRSNGAFASTGAISYDTVGTTDSGGTAVPLTGDIGEIMIYNTYLSDADCDSLYDSYLQSKWGLGSVSLYALLNNNTGETLLNNASGATLLNNAP